MNGVINIRQASSIDIPFLVETVIEAEKSGTSRLPTAELFCLTEEEFSSLLYSIFAMDTEETEGCEYSVAGYNVAEMDGIVVAAGCGWIEGQLDGLSSNQIKSELFRRHLPLDNLMKSRGNISLAQQMMITRTLGSFQLECLYVSQDARGMGAAFLLLGSLIDRLNNHSLEVSGLETQVLANNLPSIKVFEKLGLRMVERVSSNDSEILRFYGCNEKIRMFKQKE